MAPCIAQASAEAEPLLQGQETISADPRPLCVTKPCSCEASAIAWEVTGHSLCGLQEQEPMGTAGPLALARDILDDGSGDPFFVLNR